MTEQTSDDTRVWRSPACVTYPVLQQGHTLTDPVAREDAEGPLREAAEAWLGGQFDGDAALDDYQVIESLVDADGNVVQWAATFTGVGGKPTEAPWWWTAWTPEMDAKLDLIEPNPPIEVGPVE